MPVVACPKCKTKFKLSNEQLGKAVRCTSCQAKFRTPAPKAAGEGGPAKPKAKSKSKPDDGDDSMFADRQHLMNNPALKDRNPYASSGGSGSRGGSAEARKMRERLVGHEEVVKSLGFLHVLGGGLTALASLFALGALMFVTPENPDEPAVQSSMVFMMIVFGVMLVFSLVGIFVGLGLFKLENWAKIGSTILLLPNLLSIPVGTAISGYFLWALHNEKGKEVFSQKYRRAVAATPDIRPGKRLMIIVGAVFLLSFLVAVGLGVFFAMNPGA